MPGPIDGTVGILEELRQRGTPLYAITNFNQDKFRETLERFSFLRTFRDIVVSGDERLLKPDPAIYRVLLERNGIDAAACVFIDDSEKNVRGAEAVGMKAIHFTTPQALRADLAGMGLL
jgi:2-haloacid dehalogenase